MFARILLLQQITTPPPQMGARILDTPYCHFLYVHPHKYKLHIWYSYQLAQLIQIGTNNGQYDRVHSFVNNVSSRYPLDMSYEIQDVF